MQHTKIRKENLKLHALTNMQTKKYKLKKMDTTPPPCVDKAYYSKKKKVKEGDREKS